ncbi:hypothetical protein SFC43_13600 [Bacteroides sp. CR5/BHMF/2]|nr:hypothetical protein [Bacteroides sp. CR5/BHMF/2]
MEKEQFKQLSHTEAQLRKDMEAFIRASIKESQGRISLKVAEGAELESENYPVTSTLYGRHDNPQIRLTEVYLGNNDKIYADGIDDDTEEKRKEFYIYPEHYSDIFYFIGHVLNLA